MLILHRARPRQSGCGPWPAVGITPVGPQRLPLGTHRHASGTVIQAQRCGSHAVLSQIHRFCGVRPEFGWFQAFQPQRCWQLAGVRGLLRSSHFGSCAVNSESSGLIVSSLQKKCATTTTRINPLAWVLRSANMGEWRCIAPCQKQVGPFHRSCCE